MSNNRKGKRVGEKHPMFGKHHKQESIDNISKHRKGKHTGKDHHYFGKHRNEITRQKITKALTGRSLSEKHKDNLKEASLNIKKITCNHCKKEFTPWGLKNHQNAIQRKQNNK